MSDASDKTPEDSEPVEEEQPQTEDLEKPSTEKDPAEAPRAPDRDGAEPSHQAVGIGVTDPPFGAEEPTHDE